MAINACACRARGGGERGLCAPGATGKRRRGLGDPASPPLISERRAIGCGLASAIAYKGTKNA